MIRNTKLIAVLLVLATCGVVMSITSTVVNAQTPPILPCIVEGNVTINGEVAPVGTVITAKIDDEVKGSFK